MKSFLILAVLVGIGVWVYLHPLHPGGVSMATTAAPRPHRFAPQGTLYLLQYVSVRTQRGIYGQEPGTQVKLIKTGDPTGSVTVSDGPHQVSVQAAQVTNDLDLAEQAQNADQAQQSALVARQQAGLTQGQAASTAAILSQDARKQEAAAPRITLVGRVIEKVHGGLLVHCERFRPVASGMGSIGGGGGVSMPMGNESEVSGDFLVKDYPNAASVVDNDRVDVKVVEAGTYRSQDGATLRAYKVVQ